MGPIPHDARRGMLPCPADFAPTLTDNGRSIAWRGTVTVHSPGRSTPLLVEYGLSKSDPDARERVRAAVWEIKELARLGREELLGFARADRHLGAARSAPQIEIEATR